jgi:hypothetical protein
VRVRCSRCKYAFRVERPVSSEAERIERAAARALEPDTPDVTQDMPEEEEDWQFNDNRPSAGAQEPETEEVPNEPDAREPAESEIAAESGGEEDGSPQEEADADSGDAYGLGAGSVSQSVETLDGYDNDSPLAPSGLDLEGPSAPSNPEQSAGLFPEAGRETAESGLDLAGPSDSAGGLDPAIAEEDEPEPEGPPGPVADPGAPEEADASEGMENPDTWDFFAAGSTDARPTQPRVRVTASPPRAEVPRSTPVSRDLLSDESEPHSPGLERIIGSVGWVVVAVALAAGFYGGFTPDARDAALAGASQRVAGLQIADVRGRWVDNLVAGDLYVVSGTARRDAATDETARGGLFVTLFDAEGERLKLAPIPVGPPLPEALLRTADPADLHLAAGQAISPRPGVPLRVEAVIPTPPAAASTFRFVSAEEFATLHAGTAPPPAFAEPGDAPGEPLAPEPEIPSGSPNESP